jgi:ribosome-associated translation inhibitor RaiA
MQVQVHTDNHITGHEPLASKVRDTVASALSRFSHRITRVDVHLSDQNGEKGGTADKRCVMEARVERRPPVAVTYHADTLDLAVDGAAGELARLIDRTLARLEDQRSRRTDPLPPGAITGEPS